MKPQRSRSWLRWAAVPLLVGVAIWLLIPTGPQSDARRTSLSASRAKSNGQSPASNGASATNRSVRDWDSWATDVASFTAADFQALVDDALAIADPEKRSAILADILTAWLKRDARSFNKYFMALEVAGEAGKLDSLVGSLKAALASLADNIPSSQTLQEIVRRMIARLARADPKDALAWATTWLRGDTRDSALVQILGPLALRDPSQARQEIGRIAAPLRRMQALAAVGGAWANGEGEAAATWAAQLTAPTERAMALNSVFLAIAQSNPTEAASRLGAASKLMVDEYGLKFRAQLAAFNLSEVDVLNDREAYRDLLNDGALPPPNSPDVELMAEAARVIASRLAETDPAAGAAWAASLENEYLKLNAMKGALAGWGRRDPEGAIKYFVSHYSRYGEILGSLFTTWAGSDPAAAASGLRLLNNPAQRGVATEAIAQVWAPVDAARTAAWIDRLPATERTDAARLSLVTALAGPNPTEAWGRALEIADPALQYKGLKSAFAALVTRDPGAARQLLGSAQLSATNFERLGELLRAVE